MDQPVPSIPKRMLTGPVGIGPCTAAKTTLLKQGTPEGVERLTAAVELHYALLLEEARATMTCFPEATKTEQEKIARAAAGRSLDRCLALIARRTKGEA